MQQAVYDRDDEYGPSQARGGEINTYPRMYEKGAACARSAVDIWGSAWASHPTVTSVGKGLTPFPRRSIGYCAANVGPFSSAPTDSDRTVQERHR